MRSLRKNSGGTGSAGAELPGKQPDEPRTAKVSLRKPKIKLPSFKKSMKNPKQADTETNILPARHYPEMFLTFEENLQQGHLSQAGRQLIQQEEHLFGKDIGKDEERRKNTEKLERDYESLLKQIWLAVDSSLSAGVEGLERLKEAVSCIQLEEEQDRRWQKEPGALAPAWRPRLCRQTHDARIEKMVEKRMEEPNRVIRGDDLSSRKTDVCEMGVQMKEDLLKVARNLQNCYPEEFDICNLYARLYHQAFSKRLMKITEFELDVDDCAYLLSWVNNYYPNDILNHIELKEKINCNSHGNLLPVEVTRVLEEQYLSDVGAKLKTSMSTVLRKQEETWLSGALPALIEGHYSSISVDVIQCVAKAVKDAKNVVGDLHKAQPIMCLFTDFLRSYKKSLQDFLKGKRGNSRAVIKANLASLEQFENYIVTESDFFTEERRTCCLSLLNTMKDCGYQYFTKIIHADMKARYRKLGTQSWLTGNNVVMKDLLQVLEGHIEKYSDLKTSCFKELIGRLHSDVMVEYVRRLLKKKLKLKDKGQQEAAARLLCEDSKTLHAVFTQKGSKEEWLSDILPKIAEVLKTQDPSMIQLEIVTLARDYPDLSDCHVSDLLHLKTNLTNSDITTIKESLSENRNSVVCQNTRPFFSRIRRKDLVPPFSKIMRVPH